MHNACSVLRNKTKKTLSAQSASRPTQARAQALTKQSCQPNDFIHGLLKHSYNYATSDMQIGTRGRPHLNPGPTFNLSHIRTTTRHQNQIQLIALPHKTRKPKGTTSTQLPGYSSALEVSWENPFSGVPHFKYPSGSRPSPVTNRPCFVGTHY